MVATPLAVVAGAKDPHGAVAQVTVQVTPALLLTVAVMDAVALVASEVGAPLKVTVTAGGGGGAGVLLPPQPEIARANAPSVAMRMLRRNFIAHLRSTRG